MVRQLTRWFCAAFLSFGLFMPLAKAQNTIHVPTDQPSIQAAINAAAPGDTVLVAPGTYKEDITFLGKAITVTSSGGASQTIIDGGESGPVVSFINGETRNSVLNGFTITDDGPPLPTPVSGDAAGIRVGQTNPADPTITNNIITGNRGFGIEVDVGGPLIQGNTISYTVTAGNPSEDFGCDFDDGSGIQLFTMSNTEPAEVIGNIIENNQAQCRGGGIQAGYIFGPAPIVQNNIIRNNIALGEGGAISLINADELTVVQNVIYGNNAGAAGGAIYLALVSGTNYNTGPVDLFIVNNTIVGNTIAQNPDLVDDWVDGSQIAFGGYVSQTGLYNNIIESGDTYGAVACWSSYSYLSGTPPVVDHNDILNTGGPRFSGWCPDQNGSNGNISADPQFSNSSGGDFHLLAGSPAIDSGNNSAPDLPSTDFDGNIRIQNATGLPYPIIDMGAYEAAGPANLQATQIALSVQPLQPNYGTSVNMQATVTAQSAIASGSVGFFDGTTLLGHISPTSGGAASFSTTQLNAGTHVITAAFSGNSTLAGSVSSQTTVVVTGEPTTTALTYSPAQPTYPQAVTLTATVQSSYGTPAGSVTFYMGVEPEASVPLNSQGAASYTFTNLQHGDWNFYAVYPTQGPFATSTSPTILVLVQEVPTTTSLTAAPNPAGANQPVTITVTVQSSSLVPTGFVIIDDGSSELGTPNLNASGVATLTVSSLTSGAHSLTATYISADGNFQQSGSQPFNLTVTAAPPDFSLTDSPAALSLSAGQSGTSTITITPVGGYAGSVALSCSGLPASATCSFSPASVSPAGDNSVMTATLTISVAKASSIAVRNGPPWGIAWYLPLMATGFLSLILIVPLLGNGGRRRFLLPIAAIGILGGMLAASCGGGSSAGPASPASTTYTVPVTAKGTSTSGTTSHSTNLMVTITQ